MIHLFPIEPIEERYSEDWYRWWPKALEAEGLSITIYDGDRMKDFNNTDGLKTGEFLDAYDTHHYKSTQVATFMRQLQAGRVRDNDTVLLLDGWNPAVTSLAYARDVGGVQFKIVLALHAGTWDPFDHLSLCDMGKWAEYNEIGWLLACDTILVATNFHKEMIMGLVRSMLKDFDKETDIERKIKVTGFPLELDELNKYKIDWSKKKDQVVFPHRLSLEKNHLMFDVIKCEYNLLFPNDPVIWIRTQDILKPKEGKIKPDLYRILAESKVAFSAACQETWGIVQLESWFLGAAPVVPDRLSYSELYPEECLYNTESEAATMIHYSLEHPVPFEPRSDPRIAWGPIGAILRGDM